MATCHALAASPAAAASGFDPVLGVRQAAEYLGVHPQTLRTLVHRKEIACCRTTPRGYMKFRLSSLNAYLKRIERRAKRGASE